MATITVKTSEVTLAMKQRTQPYHRPLTYGLTGEELAGYDIGLGRSLFALHRLVIFSSFPSTFDTTDDSAKDLDRVLFELQQDITDFSISTIGDFSDTRPLLDSDKQRETLRRFPSVRQESLVRQMSTFRQMRLLDVNFII